MTAERKAVHSAFALEMATLPITTVLGDSERDFDFPHREAAFFYGLFLRGYPVEQLRQDIAVPAEVLAKWHRESEREPERRAVFHRIVEYRRRVLAVFERLVSHDSSGQPLQ